MPLDCTSQRQGSDTSKHQSLALLPGHPFSGGAIAVLLAMALGSWSLAAWAFGRRDLNAALWRVHRRDRAVSASRLVFVTYCFNELWRSRWRLLAWSFACAVCRGSRRR